MRAPHGTNVRACVHVCVPGLYICRHIHTLRVFQCVSCARVMPLNPLNGKLHSKHPLFTHRWSSLTSHKYIRTQKRRRIVSERVKFTQNTNTHYRARMWVCVRHRNFIILNRFDDSKSVSGLPLCACCLFEFFFFFIPYSLFCFYYFIRYFSIKLFRRGRAHTFDSYCCCCFFLLFFSVTLCGYISRSQCIYAACLFDTLLI